MKHLRAVYDFFQLKWIKFRENAEIDLAFYVSKLHNTLGKNIGESLETSHDLEHFLCFIVLHNQFHKNQNLKHFYEILSQPKK